MKRDRSQSMVIRGNRILLVEHQLFGRDFFNLPGGGIEENETPEQAALRELEEECQVKGTLVRPLTVEYKPDLESRVFTFLVEIPAKSSWVRKTFNKKNWACVFVKNGINRKKVKASKKKVTIL